MASALSSTSFTRPGLHTEGHHTVPFLLTSGTVNASRKYGHDVTTIKNGGAARI